MIRIRELNEDSLEDKQIIFLHHDHFILVEGNRVKIYPDDNGEDWNDDFVLLMWDQGDENAWIAAFRAERAVSNSESDFEALIESDEHPVAQASIYHGVFEFEGGEYSTDDVKVGKDLLKYNSLCYEVHPVDDLVLTLHQRFQEVIDIFDDDRKEAASIADNLVKGLRKRGFDQLKKMYVEELSHELCFKLADREDEVNTMTFLQLLNNWCCNQAQARRWE